jgi:hypothetical protein
MFVRRLAVLGKVADLVQIVGLPMAIVAIVVAYREGRRSRDLQAALAFAESFRVGWEGSWGKALDDAENLAKEAEVPAGDLREQLFSLLNWLDWVGWLIDTDVLARPHIVLSSIVPQLRRALVIVLPVMEADEGRHEPGYWHGVSVLNQALALKAPRHVRVSWTRLRRHAPAARLDRSEGVDQEVPVLAGRDQNAGLNTTKPTDSGEQAARE